MGLSFEYTRAVGTRVSKKKIIEWWNSAEQHALQMIGYNNYFVSNVLPPPKPHWTTNKLKEHDSFEESHGEYLNEEETIDSVLNATKDDVYEDNVTVRNDDEFRGNKTDHACSEIDNWFDGLMHEKL